MEEGLSAGKVDFLGACLLQHHESELSPSQSQFVVVGGGVEAEFAGVVAVAGDEVVDGCDEIG